eukprot:comp18006_c0_seq1/m.18447 comp18006_c0_seq1/g.18447  ORF comp18006_c0_seq1/g.18447 comp18006_c0_seq1/m.18447 type:complete len:241 (-) comp18006_c0_seq1:426-1148(-)
MFSKCRAFALLAFVLLALAASSSARRVYNYDYESRSGYGQRHYKGQYRGDHGHRKEGCLRAIVDKNGVRASVDVCSLRGVASDLRVFVDLNKVDASLLPKNCSINKLAWHVHQFWKSDSSSGVGSTECGAPITGDHVDPTLACGPKSGNPACPAVRTAIENFAYTCTPEVYKKNPYACEVGDYSSKFGTIDQGHWGDRRSFRDVAGPIVSTETMASIVFHCANTGDRAFCAKFDPASKEY